MRERKARGFFDYTLLRMKNGVMQLGLPGSVPLPKSDDEHSPKRKGGTGSRPGPNKAGRNEDGNRSTTRPPGLGGGDEAEGGEGRQLTISLADFERLLDKQSATILKANRKHAQGLLDALESRHACRLEALEDGASKFQKGISGLEERLAALEKAVQRQGHGGSAEAETRRRYTLVFGGWEKDTRKDKVLRELQEAISGLGLNRLVSEPAFTTGPRKAVAMMNFPLLASETDEGRRARMHEMVTSIAQAHAVTSAGTRLWCSYSRTKLQRDVSSHCGWLKRAVSSLGSDWVKELDVEYATGSVWLGNSLIASATRDCDPSTPEAKVLWNTRGVSKAWVDLQKLSMETGLSVDDIRMALNDTKR